MTTIMKLGVGFANTVMGLLYNLPVAVLDRLQTSQSPLHLGSYLHPFPGDNSGAPHHYSQVHKSPMVLGVHHAAGSVPATSKQGNGNQVFVFPKT
jgi:hypothetical protein